MRGTGFFNQTLTRIVIYLILIIGAFITVFPFVWMLSATFKTEAELFAPRPSLFPEEFKLDNIIRLSNIRYWLWYFNSVTVVLLRLILSLFLCSLGGFAFAKYDFPLKKPLFLILLGTIFIPFHVLLVPLFVTMARFKLIDTFAALILPWGPSAFGIFLMRQYMMGIPTELLESARIDGASGFRIYWSIILPMSKAGLSALAVVLFVFTWTSFLWPLVVLYSDTKFTLPLGLSNLMGTTGTEQLWGLALSGATLASIPIVILFIFVQRFFISGITKGALKG